MFSVNSAVGQPAAEFRLQNAGKDYHYPQKDIINHKKSNIKSQLPEYVNICTYNTRTRLGPNIENLIEELHLSKPGLTKKEFKWDIIGLSETHRFSSSSKTCILCLRI